MDDKWHTLNFKDVLSSLNSSKSGILEEDIQKLQNTHGKNTLPQKQRQSNILKFLAHFNDFLIYVLLLAAIITGLLGHFLDMSVILMVTIINALIGYIQEAKSEKALDSIRNMMTNEAIVIRNGKHLTISSEDIVIGDIVVLAAGAKVPADVRLIETNALNIEESALTGESLPVKKHTNAIYSAAPLGDRKNMAYSGTSITSGSGKGVVVAIGEYTEIGKINTAMHQMDSTITPLMQQTAQFGKRVSVAIVVLSIFIFIFGVIVRDYDIVDLLLSVIALAVGAIPEGLPAVISIILAFGVQSMAKKQAIVKNLPSVETLGAVSVICTDKTGTLTKNEMTVTDLILPNCTYEVTGTGYAPNGEIRALNTCKHDESTLHKFITCVKTVNESHLAQNKDGHYYITGDPTEGCLMTLSNKYKEPLNNIEILDKIPFDSKYKYMAYLVLENHQKRIYIKGAPDKILACTEINDAIRSKWESSIDDVASNGKRLIAAGYKDVSDDYETLSHDDLNKGIIMLGLAGIIDPPRESSKYAVQECQKAGITVKMITGDHKATAMAIGKQLGIGDGKHAVLGQDLDQMNDEEIYEAATTHHIFARTSPENKLQLVRALQHHDKIISMTGDGVNDAPALKRADIGVAMGIKGTEVSKDAARMILVDDNFDTIVDAVKEGRRVYDNLKKTILFILPTNGSQGLLIMAAILFGISIPLTPVQVLWVNMVMAVTISFALAFEPLENGAMLRPPRQKQKPLLSTYFLIRILLVSLLVAGAILTVNLYLETHQLAHNVVNTITLQSLVFALIFHLYNCRDLNQFAINRDFFKNKMAFLITAILIILEIVITYVPIFNRILKTAPLELHYWLIPIGIGLFVFIAVEIEKWFTRTILNIEA
ncbi:HAD-IC family P-type ATPase [Macrococcus armenti]|uniref:HAD-IC family P-type ATPase n=1 Tax=Macrococcus armenti TaxID=2875764 RepID=UPI001CCE2C50|nr:HAD-IC family P-type ATPase [Macrococcus armenti]UBH08686.1 HAD-IC family P-type ATPase [Macrococcus armenti]